MTFTLTINIPNLVSGWSTGIPVILSSLSLNNQNLNLPGFGAYQVLQPNNDGVITIDIPPSPDLQQYQLDVSGQRFIFIMPKQDSSLENLLVTQLETHPWFVSTTTPVGPNRDGDIWIDINTAHSNPEIKIWANNQWNMIGGLSNDVNVSDTDLNVFAASTESRTVAPSRRSVSDFLHQLYEATTGEGFQDKLNDHIHDSQTIIKAYDDAGNLFMLILNNRSVNHNHLVDSQTLPENATNGQIAIKGNDGRWIAGNPSNGGTTLTNEQFQDYLNNLISDSDSIIKDYDDATNVFKLSIVSSFIQNLIDTDTVLIANKDHRIAMRREYNLISNFSLTQHLSNTLSRITTTAWPANVYDRLVTVIFTDTSDNSIYESGKFKLADIYTKSASNGIQAGSGNSVQFTKNNHTFSISREGLSGILIAADTNGDFRVTIKIDEPDIEEWARASTTKQIDTSKLPVASSTIDGILTKTDYSNFNSAIRIDTSSLSDSDSGSLLAFLDSLGRFALVTMGTTDIEPEFDTDNNVWLFRGFRNLATLPAGSDLDNLPVGTPRLEKTRGIIMVDNATDGKISTIEFASNWIPVKNPNEDFWGFDTVPGHTNYGTSPFPNEPSILALNRHGNNSIWIETTAGFFSKQGLIISVGSNSWNLRYNWTENNRDVFDSTSSSVAPWVTSSVVNATIHALGSKPFVGTSKHWNLVLPLPPALPSWLNPDTPRPSSSGFYKIRNGTSGIGLAVTSSAQDKFTSLRLFDNPVVDLDDDIYGAGKFDVEKTLSLHTRSDEGANTSISFASNSDETTIRLTGWTFISTIKQSTNGVLIGSVDLFAGGASDNPIRPKIGEYQYYLDKNNGNRLGDKIHYDGESGSYSCSIASKDFIDFIAFDVGFRQIPWLVEKKIESGSIQQLVILNPGSGYSADPTIAIDAPPSGGTQATAGIGVTNGVISGIFIINAGSGYTSVPNVVITDSTGTGVEVIAAIGIAVNSATPSTQGSWGDWITLVETPALTDEQIGRALVTVRNELETDYGSDSNDGIIVQKRVVRTRNSIDSTIIDDINDAPKRMNINATTSRAFAFASSKANHESVAIDTVQAGDVFKLETRIITQRVSGNTVKAVAGLNNGLSIISLQ